MSKDFDNDNKETKNIPENSHLNSLIADAIAKKHDMENNQETSQDNAESKQSENEENSDKTKSEKDDGIKEENKTISGHKDIKLDNIPAILSDTGNVIREKTGSSQSRKTENKEKSENKNSDKPKNNETAKQNNSSKKNTSVKPVNEKTARNKSEISENDKSKAKSQKAKWSKKKKTKVIAGVIIITLMIVAIVIVGGFLYYSHKLNRDPDDKINSSKAPIDSSLLLDKDDTFDKAKKDEAIKQMLEGKKEPISDKDVTNILLIGEDIRDTANKDRGNTDVMMLVSINRKNKTVVTTSLMRDIYVYLENYESNKLNSAYWHEGTKLLEKTIENYFGVKVDRHVIVNFYSFIDIVEAVGGLDIKISDEEAKGMKDPLAEQNKYLKNKKGTDYLTKGGNLHLNGNQALAYARLRYVGNADFERTQRQRLVIQKIVEKAKGLSLSELDDLADKVLPQINTNITDGELASLLLDAFDLMNYTFTELRIPIDNSFTLETVNQMEVIMPNYNLNAAVMQKIIYGKAKDIDEAKQQYQDEVSKGEDNSYNTRNDPWGYY